MRKAECEMEGMRKVECEMEGSAAQCIGQGMPAQCTGRRVSPRLESCTRKVAGLALFSRIYRYTRERCSQRGHEIRANRAHFKNNVQPTFIL